MTDETGGGAADPSLKLERVGCPAPLCGAVFEIPAGRLGRNIYCLECGRRMTARPVGHTERLRAKETGGASGSGAAIERLPLAAILDDIRSLWNVLSVCHTSLCQFCGHTQDSFAIRLVCKSSHLHLIWDWNELRECQKL